MNSPVDKLDTFLNGPPPKERKWFRSWKLWLVTVLVLSLVGVVAVPLIRLQRQQALIVEFKKREAIFLLAEPVVPKRVMEFLEKMGLPSDWLELPKMAQLTRGKCDAQSFELLSRLPLLHFSVRNDVVFDPEDLYRFIARNSPRLKSVILIDCRPLPAEMMDRITHDFPGIDLFEMGECLPGVMIVNTNGEVKVATITPFPVAGEEVITHMNDQPLDTYHAIKQKLASLKPGESVRFTAIGLDGVEREEIYTAPGLRKKMP